MVKLMAQWVDVGIALIRVGGIAEGRMSFNVGLAANNGYKISCSLNMGQIRAMVQAFLNTVSEGNQKRRVRLDVDEKLNRWLDLDKIKLIKNWFIQHNAKMVAVQ